MWWAVIGTALIAFSLGFVSGVAFVFLDPKAER